MTRGDTFRGRQGGRWLEHDHQPGQLLTQFRNALVDPRPSTIITAPPEPDGDDAWEDRARMAAARRHAGHPLDAVDREALRRHPAPRTALEAEGPPLGATTAP